MKCSIRIKSLSLGGTPDSSLAGQEKHGMRLDGTSQARRTSITEPLVWGSLELRDAFEQHTEGARQNKALKRPVLHALCQFPPEIMINEKTEKMMLALAVEFIQRTHGGNAAFAARLDRDEAGKHTVDVFFAPRYEKKTKTKTETWISTSKHGKELCHKHRGEIERRHGGKFITGPRQVGMAFQTEFRDFLIEKGLKIEEKMEKKEMSPDRLSPEQFARKKAEANESVAQAKLRGLDEEKKALELKIKVLQKIVKDARDKLNPPSISHPRYRSDGHPEAPPRPSVPKN